MSESFESKWTKFRARQENGRISNAQLESLSNPEANEPIDLVELLGPDWNKPVIPQPKKEIFIETQTQPKKEIFIETQTQPRTGEWRDLGGAWTRDAQGRLVTPHNRVFIPTKKE